jgi:hypothetical protein
VSQDAGMEPRTVATPTITLYNHSARSDPQSPRKDPDLIFWITGFKDPYPDDISKNLCRIEDEMIIDFADSVIALTM